MLSTVASTAAVTSDWGSKFCHALILAGQLSIWDGHDYLHVRNTFMQHLKFMHK